MIDVMGDLRSGIRGLHRRPFYSGVVVGILALGLAAGIAVFTYINGFYQPFPGADADGLVQVFGVDDEDPYTDVSYLDYVDYAAQTTGVFQEMSAVQAGYAASIRHETMTEVAFLEAVSGSFFSVLDVQMSVGRALTVEDDRPGAKPVAVISHAWWVRQWNGDPSVIGSVLHFNYRPYTVVGVASPSFLGSLASFRPDAWLPFEPFKDRYTSWARASEDRDLPLIRIHARLRDGVEQELASSELERLAAGLDAAYPRQEDTPRRLRLAPATWIDPRARLTESSTVRMMMAAAAGLLLLVCANVGNLLLAVATGRRREMAMRAALGASRGRLLRQVLVENVLLSVLAGGVALLLAGPASARLGSYFARPSVWGANVAREATVDLRVVGFALAVSLATGVLAGLMPAFRAWRRDLVENLKTDAGGPQDGPRRIWGRRAPGARDLLVAAQVGLAVVLLVVAGLVLRTLASVGDLDPGFAYEDMVASYVSTSSTGVQLEERDEYFRNLAARLTEEPWVRAATISNQALLSPHGTVDLRLEGRSEQANVVYSAVIPGFFEAVGIDLVTGRTFTAGDTTGAPGVAIVNEVLAARYLPGADPVGRQLWRPGGDGQEDQGFEIVGVVTDARVRNFLAEPEPVAYFSNPQQAYASGSALMISLNIDPEASVPRLYRWLRDFESHIAIVNILPYTEVTRGFMYTQRMNAELFSALAFLGLALAGVGIFSVMSLAVSQRTKEIGIRMAIGARRADIGRLVVGRVVGSVVLGLAGGLAVSFAISGLLRSLLHGVEPTDPVSIVAGAGVLLAAALAAALLPARRAVSVDPIRSLRVE